jgi:hypothetical protein
MKTMKWNSKWTKRIAVELADRTPGAVHRILPGTSHITMVTHSDQSKQVADAILEVVEDVRRHRTARTQEDVRR